MTVAVIISLLLTLLLGFKDPQEQAPDAAGSPQDAPAHATWPAQPAEPTEPAEPTTSLGAPITGIALPLERVTDPVFSSGALGNGVGITPEGGGTMAVVAPAGGRLVTVVESGHAYGIRTDDGVELLIHIGLDTVELKGHGFTSRVTGGQRVERGQPLAEVDLDALRGAGKDPTTILVVTNTAALPGVVPVVNGVVAAGQSVVEIDH